MALKQSFNNKLEDKIISAYKTLDVNQISKLFKNKKTPFVVDSLNQIEDPNVIIFCVIVLQKDNQLKFLNLLDFDKQEEIFETASDSQLKLLLKNLYADEIISLIDEHQDYEKKIILALDKEMRKEISTLSRYDEDEIGRVMNPETLSVLDTWTIKKAINYIKDEYKEMELTSYVYVVDSNQKLLGIIKIHDLFFSKKMNAKLSSIMETDFYQITATDDVEEVAQMFDKYGISSAPVVDSNNTLIGFVRNTDIIGILQEEATEDIYKLYGITELKEPYLHASIWSIAKSRLFWLTILMIASTLTSVVIDQFQILGGTLTAGLSTLVLVPLIPVLTGASGNAGSQSSASVIRALSIGEITHKEYAKAIWKEFRVGLLVGGILAVINFARLLIYDAAVLNQQVEQINEQLKPAIPLTKSQVYTGLVYIALSTSLTLFVTITLSKTLGSTLPILATKLKKDPTVMSSPALATILDVVTTTLLFSIGIGIIMLIPFFHVDTTTTSAVATTVAQLWL